MPKRVLLPCLVAGLFLACCALEAHAAKDELSDRNGYYSILDYGAKGDGTTDDTAAFQKALDAAGKSGGTVLVPPSKPNKGYVITREVRVPRSVILMGSPAGFGSNSSPGQIEVAGSIILARPSKDQYAGPKKKPLLRLNSGCTVRGLCIVYDRQPMPSDEEFQDPKSPYYYKSFDEARARFIREHIKPYGPTFYSAGAVDIVVEDINCDRYYDFFFHTDGGKNFVNRIQCWGFKRAFVIERSADINRISHVHCVPNTGKYGPGPLGGKTYSWVFGIVAAQDDNIGILLGKADGYTIDDVFFFGIHTGLRYGVSKAYPLYNPIENTYGYYDPDEKKGYGGFNADYVGIGPWGDINQFKVDQCNIGIHCVWPWHLTNRISNAMIFTAFDDKKLFQAVEGTGDLRKVGKQGAFVVEPECSIANNLKIAPALICSNLSIATFNAGYVFGPTAADLSNANGRVFLIDGDIVMDLTGVEIYVEYVDPPTQDWKAFPYLYAKGPDVKRAQVKIRGFIMSGMASPDIELRDGGFKPLYSGQ